MKRSWRRPCPDMDILYADDDLLVVNKPSMLLSVPGRGEDKQDCVVSRLASAFPGIREVHRLDWETSGLMLLARHAEAHRALSRQFAERQVEKVYLAVVQGLLDEASGEIALPLRCDWPNRPRQMVDHQQGKSALTHWQRLDCDGDRCRVLLRPVTGRSHQLRVHMMSIGHPILGDRLYAGEQGQAMAERLLLHASQLAFTHPRSGQRLCLDSVPGF
ncbi:MAG: RluA family pseudouridine synthase [Chromatiales bacterium]|nr:RluA family pseudouridine synthase [Gammaproteobacteria bacterium]MBW6477346.1 RluA family pseudouridine synthase [Chromatiales bacterium]